MMFSRSSIACRPVKLCSALYAVLAVVVLSCTWHYANPNYQGYDWYWVAIFTFPWSAILNGSYNVSVPAAVIIGIVLNAAIIYSFGALLAWVGRRSGG